MTSITDLTNILVDSLGTERAAVANAARAMREADLLPTGTDGRNGAAPVNAEHAATMLIGFLGAPRVCDAPTAARLFGELPAVSAVLQRASAGRIVRTGQQVEDIPIGPGEGVRRTVLTRSLHGALTGVIGGAATDVPSACVLGELGFVRDLAAPLAWLRYSIAVPGQDLCEVEIFYAPSYGLDPCVRFQSSDLRITASTHGAVLARLGELLRGDAEMAVLADLKDTEAGAAPGQERAHA